MEGGITCGDGRGLVERVHPVIGNLGLTPVGARLGGSGCRKGKGRGRSAAVRRKRLSRQRAGAIVWDSSRPVAARIYKTLTIPT